MVKPMRDMMTKMEETVKDKTMEQLMKDPVWPTTVNTAAVALIPKEANQTPTPLDLPPISVTCLLYNLWAGTRFIGVIRWCKTWLPKSVAGSIPQNRIQECAWTVLLAMEGEEEGVATAAIDSFKFFDMIVWEVVFPMMGKMGVPESVWKLQASFVFHLKRFFRQGQSCGEVWKAMNGVVQGCSLSVVTVACITGLWMDGMNRQVPEVKATTMVDDRRLCAVGTEKFKVLEEAIEHTKKFDEEVGNKFNSKKSTVATSLMSQQKDIKKVATRQKLKHVTSENHVGCQLSQGKQRSREVQNERAAKATTTINRIGTIRSMFTFEQREHLVMSTGMTQYAFGVEGGDAGKKACASLTAAVTRTMWKDQRRRCKEIRLTTLVRGHAIDPMQRAGYQ